MAAATSSPRAPNPAFPDSVPHCAPDARLSAPAVVAQRLAVVRRRVAEAAARVGRPEQAVTLVAVSKQVGAEAVEAARDLGQLDFGESRAQELVSKHDRRGPGVRWHFVGRLQRNKVRDVVGRAVLVHSVDRFELAEAIAERARRAGRVQRILVQVNASSDPAKAGVSLEGGPVLVERIRRLRGIACEGLMTIPAADADPRAAFADLRTLRDDLRARFSEIQHLSMGMSEDVEVAVEEGATIVRVGTALFGARPATGPADAAGE